MLRGMVRFLTRGLLPSVVGLCFLACAAQPVPAPATPAPPPPVAAEAPPAAIAALVPSPLPPLGVNVPQAPEACSAFLAPLTAACPAAFDSELDHALAREDAVERDRELVQLEACSVVPLGWTRALRAELAPAECADVLVQDFYDSLQAQQVEFTRVPSEIESVLVGLALGARLRRLHSAPPDVPVPNTKAAFQRYFEEQLEPWVSKRARSIFELSSQGAALDGYGRGIVAVEAAVADLSFVHVARDVPLPEEMQSDEAVRNEYYAALDVALEPRKARGRDAALAGLAAFAQLGVLESRRIQGARSILSQSYAGHRIDALDSLRLPQLPESGAQTAELRLAGRLPTFYAQYVFADSDVTQPALLRSLMEQGLFPRARQTLDATPLTFQAAELYARALVGMGQRYWQSAAFARAAEVAGIIPGPGQSASEHSQLLLALAAALEGGPKDAREMMLGGPLLPQGVGNVAKLDALAKGTGEIAAMAAYDAATVLAFLPPTEGVKGFWRGIAERYERAATLTKDLEFKKDAKARAVAARETSQAVKE